MRGELKEEQSRVTTLVQSLEDERTQASNLKQELEDKHNEVQRQLHDQTARNSSLEQQLQEEKQGYEQRLQDQWLQGEAALSGMKQEINSMGTNFALLTQMMMEMSQKVDALSNPAVGLPTIEAPEKPLYMTIMEDEPDDIMLVDFATLPSYESAIVLADDGFH